MKYDEILTYLGEFGTYQKRLYLLLGLPMMSAGIQIMITIFTLGVPHHRCASPTWTNDSYELNGIEHAQAVNVSVPYNGGQDFDSCSVYDIGNATDNELLNITRKCNRWVYKDEPYGTTIVSQFDWVCDRKLQKSHAQMMLMLGNLIGCILSGPPADMFGRKKVYMLGILSHFIVTVGLAFATSFPIFVCLYLLIGVTIPLVFATGVVLVIELVGQSKRVLTGIGVELFWLTGCFIVTTIAYLVRHWQYIQLIVAAPSVLFLSYYWLIPESPRWLISKRRFAEADRILRHAAKVNKKTLPSDLFEGEIFNTEKQEPVWRIFSSSTLVIRCLIVFLNWCVVSLGFYGLSLNMGSLSGNAFVNIYIGLSVELVAYITCILALGRIGRKTLYCTSIICGGLCCTATIAPVLLKNHDLDWLLTALALTGRGFVSAAFAVVWLYSSELFPTVVRNSTVSIANICARVGGVISPYIANLSLTIPGDIGRAVPLVIFGSSMLVAGLLASLLPETLNQDLPETIEDAINMKRRKGEENGDTVDNTEESVRLTSIKESIS